MEFLIFLVTNMLQIITIVTMEEDVPIIVIIEITQDAHAPAGTDIN